MPSPFPGMDPFLEDEALWPTFQHQLVAGLYQILLPGLVDRYRARITQRTYTTEEPLFTSVIRQERTDEYIEIRQRADGRLVTLVDFVGPTTKTFSQGRAAYLETRRHARAQNASVVEIDLVLQGKPLLDYSRDGLPEWDYAVTVTRCTQPERFEIYTSTLSKRLPRFKVPLAPDDRDTVLDLQATFAKAYDSGHFAANIDYKRDPATRMSQAQHDWVADWLKQMKMR
ncbi:MAG TPA: DUF4058 family protein [Gemmataceae bacterium]|jgi:hypothetical protein|nr:DUF4058 family protein [Gemmataceae bacterium]